MNDNYFGTQTLLENLNFKVKCNIIDNYKKKSMLTNKL